MPKYDRPLNQILINFLKDKYIQKGEIIERQEILFWLDKNYPGFSKSTVDSYLIQKFVGATISVMYGWIITAKENLIKPIWKWKFIQ